MCGIAGEFGGCDPDGVRRMTGALVHRGPDQDGFHFGPEVGLGNRRLSVMDPALGRQPMASPDGRLTLVYNGEIYNHPRLRDELAAQGHRFQSRCDTEVVLRAFEQYGAEAPSRFRGDFACAVWDATRKRGWLVRDHLGVKPLYYAFDHGRLIFASELKALLKHPNLSFELDPTALDLYLSRLYVPAPLSICKGVHKLPPGCLLEFEQGRFRIVRYWRPPCDLENQDERAATTRTRELLDEAVRSRLVSDVPLGVFLSGGIDSSAILALAARHSSKPVKTFAIGYEDRYAGFNELDAARTVARHFGADHHEFIVRPQIEETVRHVASALDEPLGDSSAIPTFLVSRETRKEVTVALSGVGGDEVFGGYPRYQGLALQSYYGRVPASLRRVMARFSAHVPERETSRNWGGWLKRFLAQAESPPMEQYRCWTRSVRPSLRDRLLSARVQAALGTDDRDAEYFFQGLNGASKRPPVDQALYLDLVTYLVDDLLFMADRMSMSQSLEVRVPFCDHLLVEDMIRRPWNRKFTSWTLKKLLKESLSDVLPAEILKRPKQGFMIPIGLWMQKELRPLFESSFASDRLRSQDIFEPQAVQGLYRSHAAGSVRATNQLWGLLIFQLWYEGMTSR